PTLLNGLRDAKNRSLIVEIANNAVRHGDLTPHPLETHVGVLEDMLAPAFEETSDREDWESEAIDACAALAFIDSAMSKELLIRALRSASRDARIQAGFTLAYEGGDRVTARL